MSLATGFGPGDVIDRYRIEKLLGEGGMAGVYLVRHTMLGSQAALKVLRADLAEHEDLRHRFLAEGQIQAQLIHPNIVRVNDVVALPGVAALVMEYVEGPTLDAYLARRGAMPLDDVRETLLPILDGVAYAHERGVVHRDLKPGNILLSKTFSGRPRPVILDFGIAKILESARIAQHQARRTQVATRMGTVAYMSPEQLKGAENLDGRADIFALGAILYEMATGKPAFLGDTEFVTMERVVNGRFEAPLKLRPDLHPALERCIRRALASAPSARYPDCRTFARDLLETRTARPDRPGTGGPPAEPKAPAPRVAGFEEPRKQSLIGEAAETRVGAVVTSLTAPSEPLPVRRGPKVPRRRSDAPDVEEVVAGLDRADRKSLVALAIGIVSFVACCGFGHIISLILSIQALNLYSHYKPPPWRVVRRGQALAANILSWVGIVGGALMWLFAVYYKVS